jgi:hypothetical protein
MTELAKRLATLSAASWRTGSGAAEKNVRYSVNTSSVVTIRDNARSAVIAKARLWALSAKSAGATQ